MAHTLVQSMLKYVADLGEVQDTKAFFAEEAEEYREDAMTIAEQLKQQGIYEGMIQAAKNMFAKGMDLNTIKEVTGLSDKDLLKLNIH
jgi:predicted transposase/invertase (TIGR01784 family)